MKKYLNIASLTPDQNMVVFSKDYRSAVLTYYPNGKYKNGNYYKPEKHNLRYVGEK